MYRLVSHDTMSERMSDSFLMSLPWDETEFTFISELVRQRRKQTSRLFVTFLILCCFTYLTTDDMGIAVSATTTTTATNSVSASSTGMADSAGEDIHNSTPSSSNPQSNLSISLRIFLCVLTVGFSAMFALMSQLKGIERQLDQRIENSFGVTDVNVNVNMDVDTAGTSTLASGRRLRRYNNRASVGVNADADADADVDMEADLDPQDSHTNTTTTLLTPFVPLIPGGVGTAAAWDLTLATGGGGPLVLDWTRVRRIRWQRRRGRGSGEGLEDSLEGGSGTGGVSQAVKDGWMHFIVIPPEQEEEEQEQPLDKSEESHQRFRTVQKVQQHHDAEEELSTPLVTSKTPLLPPKDTPADSALQNDHEATSLQSARKPTHNTYGTTSSSFITHTKTTPQNNNTTATQNPRMSLPTDAICSICLSSYQPGEHAVRFPKCRHVYHDACIDVWVRCHVRCPLCNCNLEEVEQQQHEEEEEEEARGVMW